MENTHPFVSKNKIELMETICMIVKNIESLIFLYIQYLQRHVSLNLDFFVLHTAKIYILIKQALDSN